MKIPLWQSQISLRETHMFGRNDNLDPSSRNSGVLPFVRGEIPTFPLSKGERVVLGEKGYYFNWLNGSMFPFVVLISK